MGIVHDMWTQEELRRVLNSHQAAFLIGHYANGGKANDELAIVVCDLCNALRLSFGIGSRAGERGKDD